MASVTFTDNSAQILQAADSAKSRCLEMFGLKFQELSSRAITDMRAVDTGRLRASMDIKVDDPNDQTIVGTDVEYAPFVNNGTDRMPERNFMKAATIDSRDKYEEIVKSVWGNA